MALKLNSTGGGSVTLDAPSTASNVTMTVPATSGGSLVTADSSGNVGIGTSSPTGRLNIVSAAGTDNKLYMSGSTTAGSFAQFQNTGGSLYVGKDDSAGSSFSGAAYASVLYSSGAYPMEFFTNGSERARIDSSGNLLVGKTAASAASGVGHMFFPDGEVYSTLANSTNGGNTTLNVYSTGASAYRFWVGMGGTVYATNTTISSISDQRHKENVRDLDVGLAEILALKPRKFDWKEGKGKDIKDDRGFIAQEFEQVFPDLIDEWKDPAPKGEEPYKSVRQDLIPVLVKAIQELSAKNDALEARVAALEAK